MGFSDIVIIFFLYSFIGWVIEVLEGIINRNDFVNRGFLIGPYLPLYGFGGLSVTYLLKGYENNYIILFVMGSLICSIIEYLASFILEKIFNTRWWDYRDKKIHLNGRICPEVMFLFGIAALFFLKIVNPIIYKALLLPKNIKFILMIIILVCFIIDIIVTVKVLYDMKKDNLIQNEDITKKLNKKIKEKIQEKGYLTNRILDAFPTLISRKK